MLAGTSILLPTDCLTLWRRIAVIQGQFSWPAKMLWRDVRSSPSFSLRSS